jgi:hypothetical protein
MSDNEYQTPVTASRRGLLVGAGVSAVALSTLSSARAATGKSKDQAAHVNSTATMKDGAKIFYKDWGKGRPVVFSHGWPLTADAWDIPTLLLHGEDDQIVPLQISSAKSQKLLPDAKLTKIPGAPHGLCVTHADKINAELLAFAKA